MRNATRLAGFAALVVLCCDANAAIKLVAHKTTKELTGAESTAIDSPGYESQAGNLIVVWAVAYTGSQPVATVTDSAGDTFIPATLQKGTWYGQFFYAKNVKGDPFNVITVHPALAGRATFFYVGMDVLEYSGADKNAPLGLDIAGQQGMLNGGWTSAPFNAAAGEVAVFGIVTANGGAFAAGPGFKVQDFYHTPTANKFSFAVMDQTFATAQTGITANVTWTGTFQSTGAVITIKPAAASGKAP